MLNLSPKGLLTAYMHGIFPMADPATGEIWWFRPDPRAILPIHGMHVSRSLRRVLRSGKFDVTVDRDFEGVMRGCADREETWISEDLIRAYTELFRMGYAHSIETWREGSLVGGVYGVSLGAAFMAESMFHRETDASKVALHALVTRLAERGYELLDVQYQTPHLASLGVIEISLAEYLRRLAVACRETRHFGD
ncbi:MAG: leucyl/phenylalanyl-tRNA--protein transferase [Fimbriimonadales bacterium]